MESKGFIIFIGIIKMIASMRKMKMRWMEMDQGMNLKNEFLIIFS